MPKHTFGDQDNREWTLIPEGEYRYEVVGFDTGLSQGPKTRGSDKLELKLRFIDAAGNPLAMWTEDLILHPSMDWKVDTFLKSSNLLVNGQPPAKGEAVDLCAETVLGLRGWAFVVVEKYTRKDGSPGESNRVKTWITTKPKLERADQGLGELDEDGKPMPF